jgi:hypothetical protein
MTKTRREPARFFVFGADQQCMHAGRADIVLGTPVVNPLDSAPSAQAQDSLSRDHKKKFKNKEIKGKRDRTDFPDAPSGGEDRKTLELFRIRNSFLCEQPANRIESRNQPLNFFPIWKAVTEPRRGL